MSKIKKTQIEIAFCIDNNFVQHLCVTLCSICENFSQNTQKIRFHIIKDCVSYENTKILKDFISRYTFASMVFYEPEKRSYEKYKTRDHITKSTYFRISLPNIIPQSIDKILYLDADIVVNMDISKLWEINLNKYYLGATKNIEYNSGKLEKSKGEFNAGVMLLDLSKWRNDLITEKTFNYLDRNTREIRFEDQSALNAVLKDKWLEINLRFNVQSTIYLLNDEELSYLKLNKDMIKDFVIIHYSDVLKPWHYRCEHPEKKLYYKYIILTPWKRFNPSIDIIYILKKKLISLYQQTLSKQIRDVIKNNTSIENIKKWINNR